MTSEKPGDAVGVRLLNPLPAALGHYSLELTQTLAAGQVPAWSAEDVSIESGERGRAAALFHLMAALRRSRGYEGPQFVLWPSLGYLELLAESVLAPRAHLIFHDSRPMRRQFGMHRWQGRAVAPLARLERPRLVVHSEGAAEALTSLGWPEPVRLPHPLLQEDRGRPDVPLQTTDPEVCTILGQYKPSRSVAVLGQLPTLLPRWRFRIVGRNWPSLPGFEMVERFVTEEEFDDELRSASVILIPYESFFQSNVLVRALEARRPAVSIEHEQTRNLYGATWPGMVSEWSAPHIADALTAVSSVDEATMDAFLESARTDAVTAWANYVGALY